MKYKINKGIITQKFEGKTIIFDSDESVLYTFNETATFIFNKLKNGSVDKKIIEEIVKRYSIKEGKAKQGLKALIADLKRKKIISSIKSNN